LVNDVWAQRPVYLTGKYSGTVDGTVVLTGISGAAEYKQPIHIHLPGTENSNGMLPSLWARGRVNELMSQLIASHDQRDNVGLEQEIKQLGIQYHIMTKFTSFVAVDTSTRVTPSQETKAVPVETPNGVMLRQIFPSAAQPIRPTGLLKLPQEIGRVEGPRDMNMFQVEPTVIDERHYTSGRAERHQKTSPTLPEGSPIPDSASNFKTPDRSEQLPAPIESAPRLPYSEKLSAELLTLLSQATAPGKLVKLSIHLNSITPGSIAQLKKEGAKILSLSKSTKLITIEIQIGKLQRLIALPNIQRVQLVIK
jgi:hypothetical protein